MMIMKILLSKTLMKMKMIGKLMMIMMVKC